METLKMRKAKSNKRGLGLRITEFVLVLSIVAGTVAFSFGGNFNNEVADINDLDLSAETSDISEWGAIEINAFNPNVVSATEVTADIINRVAAPKVLGKLPATKNYTVNLAKIKDTKGLWGTDGRLYWNENQFLPKTPVPAPTLDYVALRTLSSEEETMFATLQGVINRTQPRIYLMNEAPADRYQTWEHDLNLKFFRNTDPYSLITKYAKELNGVIIYDDKDPSVAHSVNLASAMAGFEKAIVVNGTIYNSRKMQDIIRRNRFKVIMDMRGMFRNKWEVYDYMADKYLNRFNNRVIINISPDVKHHIRDYAIAIGSPIVFLDPDLPRDKPIMDRFMRRMISGQSVVMGWWPDEGPGVDSGTRYGIPTVPADWSPNISVHAGYRASIIKPPTVAKPRLENKSYIAYVMSDGDNLQYCQGRLHEVFHDPLRGQIAMTYTMAPPMIDVFPRGLNWFYRQATRNDCFVSGPSGYGYFYPSSWDADRYSHDFRQLNEYNNFKAYLKRNNEYFKRASIKGITIWNGPAFSRQFSDMYAQHMPYLSGVTVQGAVTDNPRLLNKGTFLVKQIEMSYASEIYQFEQHFNGIVSQRKRLKAPGATNQPTFHVLQGVSWGTMGLFRNYIGIGNTAKLREPDIEFVRYDTIFELQKEFINRGGR